MTDRCGSHLLHPHLFLEQRSYIPHPCLCHGKWRGSCSCVALSVHSYESSKYGQVSVLRTLIEVNGENSACMATSRNTVAAAHMRTRSKGTYILEIGAGPASWICTFQKSMTYTINMKFQGNNLI